MLMSTSTIPPAAVNAAVCRAISRIAPVWPLQDFVAVNPFLGFANRNLTDTALQIGRATGARVVMPPSFYAGLIEAGRIKDQDLAAARAELGPLSCLPLEPPAIAALACSVGEEPAMERSPSVAALAESVTRVAWEQIVTDRLSAWAAGYFDQGQAVWSSPWQQLPPFAAWKAEARRDRTASIWGLPGFRALVQALPDSAEATIHEALHRLGVSELALDAYFDRLLASIGGWAAYARQLLWQQELRGGDDETLPALLAARLTWEVALLEGLDQPQLRAAWAEACATLSEPPGAAAKSEPLALQTLLQTAYERAWQRDLAARLDHKVSPAGNRPRPAVQAVFCIDVRSEVFRRALEAETREVETLGFAGFFGFAVSFRTAGAATATDQCPVLLAPQYRVGEAGCGHRHAAPAGPAWQAFRRSSVSAFAFVETLGLTYAGKLIADGLAALTGKAQLPETGQNLDLSAIPADHRAELAEGALRGMSLTRGFARLVLLAGHGASTRNNPHARGLDCGACGGHSGAPNARLAAAVLNDPAVRETLAERGIAIPADTVFAAGLHDTTTDELDLLDTARIPGTHADDLRRLTGWLARAGQRCRAERATGLGIEARANADRAILARSRDWSQVRPEWGLAGCAGFIAAPRVRTASLNLKGRCFLHSYDWRQDDNFSVLELILTAPVIVASWIVLQYYASVVDNRTFGSGNKALHNVTAGLGVLEGNGGDLRTGLPWQSVHDGKRLVHEPLRLTVAVEAPAEAIGSVIARHPSLQNLLDNEWIHLLTLDDAGQVQHRYRPGGEWIAFETSRRDCSAMPELSDAA